MSVNLNPSKQGQEVIFSRKCQNLNHGSVYFSHNLAQQVPSQKHLDNIISKVDKTIGLLCKLQAILLHPSLVTIYKAFIRHLDYGYIIYGQAYKESFHQKLESMEYNAALAITGAKRGTLSRARHRISSKSMLV